MKGKFLNTKGIVIGIIAIALVIASATGVTIFLKNKGEARAAENEQTISTLPVAGQDEPGEEVADNPELIPGEALPGETEGTPSDETQEGETTTVPGEETPSETTTRPRPGRRTPEEVAEEIEDTVSTRERKLYEDTKISWYPLEIPSMTASMGIFRPILEIEKKVSAIYQDWKKTDNLDVEVKAGDIIVYEIKVSNSGNLEAKNVSITESLPVKLINDETELNEEKYNNLLLISAGDELIKKNIPAKTEAIFKVAYQVTPNDIGKAVGNQGQIFNKATVTYNGDEKETEEIPTNVKIMYTYKVEHYLQNLDCETYPVDPIDKVEYKDVLYGSDTIYEEKNYEGFTFDDTLTKNKGAKVPANDDLVIELYYTRNLDVSYTVKYLEKDTDNVLAEQVTRENNTFGATYTETPVEVTGYTPVESELTITLDAYNKELIFYYTANTDVSYIVKYLEQGTDKVLATEAQKTGLTFGATYTEKPVEVTGYTPVESELTITLDAYNKELIFYYIANTDVSYTVKYLEKDTNNVLAEQVTRTDKTFNETYTEDAVVVTGYTVDAEQKEITLDAYNKELIFYYTANTNTAYKVEHYWQDLDNPKNYTLHESEDNLTGTTGAIAEFTPKEYAGFTYNEEKTTPVDKTILGNGSLVISLYYDRKLCSYKVEHYYEMLTYETSEKEFYLDDTRTDGPISVPYGSEINSYISKTDGSGYAEFKVETEEIDREMPLTISEKEENNVIKVYYVRNNFTYTVKHWTEKLGYTSGEDKWELNSTENYKNKKFGDKADYQEKDITGFEFDDHLTDPKDAKVPANNDLVINLYYKRNSYDYKVQYFYNGDHKDEFDVNNTALYEEKIAYDESNETDTRVPHKENENGGGWTFKETKPEEGITIGTVVANNVIKVYYVKPDITVVKSIWQNDVKLVDNDTIEAGSTVTYKFTATNIGHLEGEVTIKDPDVPVGVISNIKAGDNEYNETNLKENGITLTVPARGKVVLSFDVKLEGNIGDLISNVGEYDGGKTNEVVNPVEKTVHVKAKTSELSGCNIIIVLDTSGSMDYLSNEIDVSTGREFPPLLGLINGWVKGDDGKWYKLKSRIQVAKETIGKLIDDLDLPGVPTDCSSVVNVIKFSESASSIGCAEKAGDKMVLKNAVNGLSADGGTRLSLRPRGS